MHGIYPCFWVVLSELNLKATIRDRIFVNGHHAVFSHPPRGQVDPKPLVVDAG